MALSRHRTVLREIESMTIYLVSAGLVDDQNSAYEKQIDSSTYRVQYVNTTPFSAGLAKVNYGEMYRDLRASRAFNFLMLDGALIQMFYEFGGDVLLRHRLAFLPAPDLLDFQNHPEIYARDVLFADVIDKRVVTVPFRFDYDRSEDVAKEIEHPKSHMTLGQYARCRVPVTAGVTPHAFMDFVLRSFYNSALSTLSEGLPAPALRFDQCIAESERRVVHIAIPTHT